MINLNLCSEENWIDALKPYQRRPIEQFIKDVGEEEAIDKWLMSSGSLQTSPFGGVPIGGNGKSAFALQFKKEFKSFICGGEKYKNETGEVNKLISEHKANLASIITSIISTSLAMYLGASAALIAPAVVLMLRILTKVGVEAWCAIPVIDEV